MAGLDPYYQVLQQIHQLLRPRTYVEVGVRHGESWRLTSAQSMSIGIDPNPHVLHPIEGIPYLFKGTSDDFFQTRDVKSILHGLNVDLAFIDGMHHFEYALRDVMNIEQVASERSIILLHDCLPASEETATRERRTSFWSGDIWKVIVCLQRERPDLDIKVFDAGPTGLGIIQNLDPNNKKLIEQYDEIESRYIDLPFSFLGDPFTMREKLNVISSDQESIEATCSPKNRFRSLSSLSLRNKGSRAESSSFSGTF